MKALVPMVYVAWHKDANIKNPLYIGSSIRGIHRALGNKRLMEHKDKIGIIEFHRCQRYSDALTLEAKLTHELRPSLDLMWRKPGVGVFKRKRK
jgi:hypothetical protein